MLFQTRLSCFVYKHAASTPHILNTGCPAFESWLCSTFMLSLNCNQKSSSCFLFRNLSQQVSQLQSPPLRPHTYTYPSITSLTSAAITRVLKRAILFTSPIKMTVGFFYKWEVRRFADRYNDRSQTCFANSAHFQDHNHGLGTIARALPRILPWFRGFTDRF